MDIEVVTDIAVVTDIGAVTAMLEALAEGLRRAAVGDLAVDAALALDVGAAAVAAKA